MKRTAVVLQSNYIPWKGYFDLINDADVFVFHDDLQFTKNDWRNRNKIKTSKGLEWLTIPVGTNTNRLICEVSIADSAWQKRHWDKIKQSYHKSRFWRSYEDFFRDFYLDRTWTNLSELNHYLIKTISRDFLGIHVEFLDSRQFNLTGRKQARLLELLNKMGATHYVSGPAAKEYISEDDFRDQKIEIEWKNYEGYPEYPQQFPGFDPFVSILDLLFNLGDSASDFIWGWRNT